MNDILLFIFLKCTKQCGYISNNFVYGILEDKNGNLWISTNLGISRFNLATETFKNYTIQDGLQSNEFNGGAYYKSKTGL